MISDSSYKCTRGVDQEIEVYWHLLNDLWAQRQKILEEHLKDLEEKQ